MTAPTTTTADDLRQRLRTLKPSLERICKNAGVPGASIGILHNAKPLHSIDIGFRDVERKILAISNTIYGIGSLTRAFAAVAVAQCVQEGLVSWEVCLSTQNMRFQVLGFKNAR